MSDIRIRGPLADCDAESVLRSAWADYGGNNMDAEFWQVFSEAANYTLKMAAACLGQSPDPDISGFKLTEQICFDKVKKERDAYRKALEPFAQEADRLNDMFDDETPYDPGDEDGVRFRQFRHARSILSQPTEGE